MTLSQTQLQVGVPVTASLKDPDDSISTTRWQWSAREGIRIGDYVSFAPGMIRLASDSDGATDEWISDQGRDRARRTRRWRPMRARSVRMRTMTGLIDDAMCLQATASYLDAVKNVDPTSNGDPITVDDLT